MSVRVAPKTETVARCISRRDGGFMVVTLKGQSAASVNPIPEGARIVIRDGQAERVSL